jgi:hypothetical protein
MSGYTPCMLLFVDGDRATLRSRATPDILLLLPRLEGRRRWTAEGLSLEASAHNLRTLREALPALREGGREPEAPRVAPTPVSGPGNGPFRRSPDPHQRRALEAVGELPVFGLFMEQGTGKTKVKLDWASALFRANAITGMLVVTKKGVHRQWVEEEAPKDLSVDFSGQWWNGKPLQPFGPGLQLFTVNYDALRSAKTLAIVEEFCRAHRGRLLIVADESQEIKNHRSLRHKAMMKLRPYSSHRAIATGTPIAKDLTDEWSQLLWLDDTILGMRYLTTFRAKFCIMGGFEGRAVVGHKSMDEFKALTARYVFRATKDELGLLPKRRNEWKFDLTKRQLEMMRELKRDLATRLDSGELVSVNGAADALTKAQQIANGFVISENECIDLLMPVMSNPRVIAALDWLNANEGKAIVWARFRGDIAILSEAFRQAGVSFVVHCGETKKDDRAAAVKSFMDPDGAQVLLATAATAGTGLNLQGQCQRNLYYSNSFNAIDRWQSEDRTHRKGTVGAVTYTDLIATKSLDRYILANLSKKEALSAARLDDLRASLRD